MADIKVPEEFLFGVSRSIEDLSVSQRKISDNLTGLGESLDGLNKTVDSISSLANQNPLGEDFSRNINDLTSAINNQIRTSERSSKEMFDILRPQETQVLPPALDIPGILSALPRFEEGGEMQKSGAAIVGEAGPELLLLPESASVSPIDANSFDQFQEYFESISLNGLMQEILGTEKAMVRKNADNTFEVIPSSADQNFEPFNLIERVESRIALEQQIEGDITQPGYERRAAKDIINFMEAFKNELLPQLDFRTILPESVTTEPFNLEPNLATETEGINQTDFLNQTATPNLTASIVEEISTGAAESLAELTPSPSVLSSPATANETLSEESAETVVTTEPSRISELTVTPGNLVRSEVQNLPAVQPAVTQPQVIESAPQEQIPTRTSSEFPKITNVRISEYQEGESIMKEMRDSLAQITSLMSQMNNLLSRTQYSSDSYPIRPSNKNF